jgi:uncharacterized protein (TIGR00730 family)
MEKVCVFCGSNAGNNPAYREAAENLAMELVERNITLVFGAGNIGLMGILADTVLQHGGKAIGVIPDFLKTKEVAHTGLSQLIVVKSMHERKQIMADLSDGFIAMPGGFGTLDELCEILTWAQLGLHGNPIGLLNVHNYFTGLVDMFDHMVDEGFLHPKNRAMVINGVVPDVLLNRMDKYEPPDVSKWLDRALT